MQLIQTSSFELAVNIEGKEDADHMALLIPGRLDTKDYANFVSHTHYLAERGFLAISFDPPGTWESPGSIDLYTTTNYLKAIQELIEYFGNKTTLLIGHSRGGTVSMLAASHPCVEGIALVMANFGSPTPPTDEARALGYQLSHRDIVPGDHVTDEQKEFHLPMHYWSDGAQYDPLEALKNYVKPKLIIYGTNDEFVTPTEAQEIYDLMPEPKMLKEVESDHDYRYSPQAISEVNEVLGEFIEKFKL